MHFIKSYNGIYIGRIETGKKCLIEKGGVITYLKSQVSMDGLNWVSEDAGFDINTNQKIWGSEHGPLKFKKINSLDLDIAKSWETNN